MRTIVTRGTVWLRGTTRRARFARDERGAALVEFALVFLVLMMFVFGIVDFGRALYWANTLQVGVRDGARYAAVLSNPAASSGAISDTVVSRLQPLGGTTPKASDVTVTFNYSTSTPATLQSTTVSISYPYTPITPIASLVGLGTINLSASARFRWEFAQ